MSEPPIPRPPAPGGADRLTGLDGPPCGVAPVLVQVLDGDGLGDSDTRSPEPVDAATLSAEPEYSRPWQPTETSPTPMATAATMELNAEDPVAALRQCINAAGTQLGNLQALRQERDGLQQRCRSLEGELEDCRQALQQSQEQLAAARQQLAEVDALQRQLQQLLEP